MLRGKITVGSQRQGKNLRIIRFRHVRQVREGGGRARGSAGGEPLDCVEARRAGAASALAPTVAALSSLSRDVLRLLRSGLVCTFLSEGECGDVAGGVRTDSGTVVLLSAKETREVLGRLGGGGTALPRRSGGGDRRTVTGRMEPPRN